MLNRRLAARAYAALDPIYRRMERSSLSRGAHLSMIPRAEDRRGGTTTYIEWGWTIGFFQPLIYQHLPKERPLRVLDVGSGVGRLALSYWPYLQADDRYVGLEVARKDVDFCRTHYRDPRFSFVHLEAGNRAYAPGQSAAPVLWPLEDSNFDLITALSIWTHFDEPDANFYLNEVARVLKPGRKAIISFFVLDELYRYSLPRNGEISGYYPQPRNKWVFDTHAHGSSNWFCPSWAKTPEAAVGIKEQAFKKLIGDAGLRLVEFHPGCWKEQPGLFFQDIAVLTRD